MKNGNAGDTRIGLPNYALKSSPFFEHPEVGVEISTLAGDNRFDQRDLTIIMLLKENNVEI